MNRVWQLLADGVIGAWFRCDFAVARRHRT